MKKIFIICVILSELMFALKPTIERNKNSIIPSFLRLNSNQTLITLKTSYDSLTHKTSVSAHLHLYIRLFSKEINSSKPRNNQNKSHSHSFYQYQYKTKLGLRIKQKKPLIELKNSFKLSFKNLVFYEAITPAIPISCTENTTLQYRINNKVFFFNKSFTYKKKGMSYSLGIEFYKFYLPKFIKTITFSINGNTSLKPLFYSYKLSTSYRYSLMHKKYFYLDINPYILISKQYNYKLKPAISISINYNF